VAEGPWSLGSIVVVLNRMGERVKKAKARQRKTRLNVIEKKQQKGERGERFDQSVVETVGSGSYGCGYEGSNNWTIEGK